MIRSFRNKATEAVWEGKPLRSISLDVQNVARRKLRMLNNAQHVFDLRAPPGNRLEALQGDRVGQFSVRINDQWRLCFSFRDGDAWDVEIVDYH